MPRNHVQFQLFHADVTLTLINSHFSCESKIHLSVYAVWRRCNLESRSKYERIKFNMYDHSATFDNSCFHSVQVQFSSQWYLSVRERLPSLRWFPRRFPSAAFETVPVLVWLTIALSHPFKADRRPMPFLFLRFSQAMMVRCPWLCARRLCQHFRSSETQATCDQLAVVFSQFWNGVQEAVVSSRLGCGRCPSFRGRHCTLQSWLIPLGSWYQSIETCPGKVLCSFDFFRVLRWIRHRWFHRWDQFVRMCYYSSSVSVTKTSTALKFLPDTYGQQT